MRCKVCKVCERKNFDIFISYAFNEPHLKGFGVVIFFKNYPQINDLRCVKENETTSIVYRQFS